MTMQTITERLMIQANRAKADTKAARLEVDTATIAGTVANIERPIIAKAEYRLEMARVAGLIRTVPAMPHAVAVAFGRNVCRYGWLRTIVGVARAGAGIDGALDAAILAWRRA